mmetsp:Transcript_1461/g.3702  ORF Transcript_1461/g.3702 Transcript_1461/m.3702 type:complete len:217 (-) Transcript_1461:694-1344(-)
MTAETSTTSATWPTSSPSCSPRRARSSRSMRPRQAGMSSAPLRVGGTPPRTSNRVRGGRRGALGCAWDPPLMGSVVPFAAQWHDTTRGYVVPVRMPHSVPRCSHSWLAQAAAWPCPKVILHLSHTCCPASWLATPREQHTPPLDFHQTRSRAPASSTPTRRQPRPCNVTRPLPHRRQGGQTPGSSRRSTQRRSCLGSRGTCWTSAYPRAFSRLLLR